MKYPKTKEVLYQLTADLNQLYFNIRQTHWYMRGNGFLYYHPLMDDWMDEIHDQLDEVAERLITIDGHPCATASDLVKDTKLKDQPKDPSTSLQERFQLLSDDYRYLADAYGKGIEAAQEEGDTGSEDILTGFKADTEKRIWMIQAELGKAPEIDN